MVAVKLEHSNLMQHQAGIIKQMRHFWMENHFCDVVLKGNDGAEHRAHTAFLSASSVYFQNLLGGSFLEADRVQQKQPVEIAASEAAVSALLDFIYGGQPEVNLEVGLELVRLAEAYDLPKFASAVEAGLRVSLDGVKALRILEETHGLRSLKAACEEKVAEDFEACSQHPDFGKLSASQLARILKREDLRVSREEVVFKGIFNWLKVSSSRGSLLGMLLQHVDFKLFSIENLNRIGRFTLSGQNAEELHREVDEALNFRLRKRAESFQSSHDFQPKRRCLKHWTPDLGASAEDPGRKALSIYCYSLSWHAGHVYATDFEGNVLCWKPGDPATSVRKVAGAGAPVTGINDFEHQLWEMSIAASGEIFLMDKYKQNQRIVRLQDRCGHLVCGDIDCRRMSVSPEGVVYVLSDVGDLVQKLVGSTLQTVLASESLPEDQQFEAVALFAAQDEVIYFTDILKGQTRVLRFNPTESLEPVVVGQVPESDISDEDPWPRTIFVTKGETIYVGDECSSKVLAFHCGDTTPTEVLQLPAEIRPTPSGLLVQGTSLYVSAVDHCEEPTAGGIYEYLLPPELQLE